MRKKRRSSTHAALDAAVALRTLARCRSLEKLMDAQLARYERIIKATTALTEQEKAGLMEWERNNVTGNGKFATNDWPGWDEVIKRISH
jgi:hypothetical protein